MKIRINQDLKNRIISGGLSIVLIMSGFVAGKIDSKINTPNNETDLTATKTDDTIDELTDKYLSNYVSKRNNLEAEINDLKEQKKQLQNVEVFDINKLTVIENNDINNESNLYILCQSLVDCIYDEYHGLFRAYYRLDPNTTPQDHVNDFCPVFIHFDEGEPLFNYLTDEEMKKLTENGGTFTTTELDEILNRLRKEYKENQNKDTYKKQLQKN